MNEKKSTRVDAKQQACAFDFDADAPEQDEGDDEGQNASGAVAEEKHVLHVFSPAADLLQLAS